MYHILLNLVLSTYMGEYNSQAACENAIKQIYITRMYNVNKEALATTLKTQRTFICVPK